MGTSKADPTQTTSSGAYDLIVDKAEWEQKTGMTKQRLMDAIPDHCKERSALWSFVAVFRDLFYATLVVGVFYAVSRTHLDMELPSWFPSSLIQNAWAEVSSALPESIHRYLRIFPCHWITFHQESSSDNLFFVLNVDTMLAESYIASLIFWSTYAFLQGTVLFGLWVMGHECGHGAFSPSQLLNDIVGYVLHTGLLVPYFAWQYSHAKHHKHTNHLLMDEAFVPCTETTSLVKIVYSLFGSTANALFFIGLYFITGWPMYLFFHSTGARLSWKGEDLRTASGPIDHFRSSESEIFPPVWRKCVSLSCAGMVAMVGLLATWAVLCGFDHLAKWYIGPYLVVNAWLVLYTWLQHTHADVPHLGEDAFSWLRGALCTVDRPYPSLVDHLHHRLGTTHVLHHLNSRIPHYHAQEATKTIIPVLGELYRYDPTPILKAAFLATNCDHVNGLDGIQMYQSASMKDKTL